MRAGSWCVGFRYTFSRYCEIPSTLEQLVELTIIVCMYAKQKRYVSPTLREQQEVDIAFQQVRSTFHVPVSEYQVQPAEGCNSRLRVGEGKAFLFKTPPNS